MQKDNLQDKLGETTFVPKIFIIRFKGSTELHTSITWGNSISEVIPKCDYILVMQEKSNWLGFGKMKNNIVVPYNKVVDRLRAYLEPFDLIIPGTMILQPERQFDALDEFNKLEGMSFEAFEGVEVESFIDYMVPTQQDIIDNTELPKENPIEYNQINMNSEDGFQDLEFRIVDYSRENNGNHLFKVRGKFNTRLVGFDIEIKADLLPGFINNDPLTVMIIDSQA